ncbi:MAG: DUF4910 domain-containing protein [Anaerolineae bacterium]|nr:DUF4910 domain-containing protein [Anaerolineae bacterium]
MFEPTLNAIRLAYSGERAKRHIANISQHHRIQASPGYRAAARYVQAQLDSAGLFTELLSYPADHQTTFWTMESFQEWACSRATLDLLQGEQAIDRLCDFEAVPISVIQRSAAAQGDFEVVVLDDGTEHKHYDGLDIAGKLVLSDGNLGRVYDLAVRRRGAAGILFDGMATTAPGRGPLDLPDARQYTSFWWGADEPRCFGFVLTPRQGRRLRQNMPVRVRAHVVSALYDGAFEVVAAFIPGQTDEEVLVVSHLCHPQPSANDNASGAAAAIEIAATLRRLIDQGTLPPARRGIRFLWMPEMTGTYAYLANCEERLPRTVAGVNLDMVGQNQERCHSVFNIEQPPEAMASFAPVLMKRLWDMLSGDADGHNTFELSSAAVRHRVTSFSGGSDHYILSDPTVGVPTPMLIQWPDRFYHTSEDTLDKVDPAMVARIGSLAAAYAYVIAGADERTATWLGHEIVARRQVRLVWRTQAAITAALAADDPAALITIRGQLRAAVAHRIDCDMTALQTLERLWPDCGGLVAELSAELNEAARRELSRADHVFRNCAKALGSGELPPDVSEPQSDGRARNLIPQRQYRGPVALRSLEEGDDPMSRDALWQASKQAGNLWWTARSLAEYWADGQRSVDEISDKVYQETGQRFDNEIMSYFEILEANDLLRWRDEEG